MKMFKSVYFLVSGKGGRRLQRLHTPERILWAFLLPSHPQVSFSSSPQQNCHQSLAGISSSWHSWGRDVSSQWLEYESSSRS